MVIGLLSGFYYRELTKAHDFVGDTQLSLVHTHTLILGMFMFLLLLPLEKVFKLSSYYLFNWFFFVYHLGVLITISMMTVKGTFQVIGKKFYLKCLRICRHRSYRYACRFTVTFFLIKTGYSYRTQKIKSKY